MLSVGRRSQWRVANQLTNNNALTVDGIVESGSTLINAGAFNINASGQFFGHLLSNTAGTINNRGFIAADIIEISAGTVALIGTGRLNVTPFFIESNSIRLGYGRVNLTNAAGTFDISGTNAGATILKLDGVANSHVTLGTQTLTLNNGSTYSGVDPASFPEYLKGNYAGIIKGTGGLTIAAGTHVLSGINTYTGATNIDAGNLVVNGSIASSSV